MDQWVYFLPLATHDEFEEALFITRDEVAIEWDLGRNKGRVALADAHRIPPYLFAISPPTDTTPRSGLDLKEWLDSTPQQADPNYESVQLILQLASHQYLCDTELALASHWEYFGPVARELLRKRRERNARLVAPGDSSSESSHSDRSDNANTNGDPDSDFARRRDPSTRYYTDDDFEDERLRTLAFVPKRRRGTTPDRAHRLSQTPPPRTPPSSSATAPHPPRPPTPPPLPDNTTPAKACSPSSPTYVHSEFFSYGPCEQWCECYRCVDYEGLPRDSDDSYDSRQGSDEPFSDEEGYAERGRARSLRLADRRIRAEEAERLHRLRAQFPGDTDRQFYERSGQFLDNLGFNPDDC